MAVIGIILYLALIIFFVYCYCKIAGRAGFSPWMGLVMLIPIANIVLLYMFALKPWPIESQGGVNPNTFS